MNTEKLLFEIPPLPKKPKLRAKKPAEKKPAVKNEDDELKKTHHNHPAYRRTMERWDETVKEISTYSFKKLFGRLDIIRQQMGWAFAQKKYNTYELLMRWEEQTFEAILTKFDKEAEETIRKQAKRKGKK